MSLIGRAVKLVEWKKNQRLRQVKEVIRISQSPCFMTRDQGAYNLTNIYWPLFTTSYQSSGKRPFTYRGRSVMMVLDENQNCDVTVSEYFNMLVVL